MHIYLLVSYSSVIGNSTNQYGELFVWKQILKKNVECSNLRSLWKRSPSCELFIQTDWQTSANRWWGKVVKSKLSTLSLNKYNELINTRNEFSKMQLQWITIHLLRFVKPRKRDAVHRLRCHECWGHHLFRNMC